MPKIVCSTLYHPYAKLLGEVYLPSLVKKLRPNEEFDIVVAKNDDNAKTEISKRPDIIILDIQDHADMEKGRICPDRLHMEVADFVVQQYHAEPDIPMFVFSAKDKAGTVKAIKEAGLPIPEDHVFDISGGEVISLKAILQLGLEKFCPRPQSADIVRLGKPFRPAPQNPEPTPAVLTEG